MRLLLSGLLLLSALQLCAQRTSTYSRFGFGNLHTDQFSGQQGQGKIGTAFNDVSLTNFDNPASLALKQFTAFNAGVAINIESQQDAIESVNQTNGTVSYLAFSFPMNKSNNWGTGFGITPFSTKEYNIVGETVNNTFFSEFQGTGNTYRGFVGTGFKLGKNFLIGAEGSLLFGHLEDQSYTTFQNLTDLSTGATFDQRLSGVVWKGGIQYDKEIRQDLFLTFGGTYRLKSDINNTVAQREFSFRPTFSGPRDVRSRAEIEEFLNTETKEKVKLPGQLGAGVYIDKKVNLSEITKWGLGLDFRTGQWEGFTGINDSPNQKYQNAYDIALGGNFIPNLRTGKFFESLQYRYGAHYGQTYLNLDDESINDYGITLGVGIPVKVNITNFRENYLKTSMVNVGIQVGQTGTLKSDLVRESYIRATIGANLNDIWFRKPKYD